MRNYDKMEVIYCLIDGGSRRAGHEGAGPIPVELAPGGRARRS